MKQRDELQQRLREFEDVSSVDTTQPKLDTWKPSNLVKRVVGGRPQNLSPE